MLDRGSYTRAAEVLGISQPSVSQQIRELERNPPSPAPAMSIAPGRTGDLQLGVYVASAGEMFESPSLFLQPSSRVFMTALTVQFGSVLADAADVQRAHGIAQRFLTADGPNAWKSLRKDWQGLLNGVTASLKAEPQRRKTMRIATRSKGNTPHLSTA